MKHKKSAVLAACAITKNAHHVNAGNANTNILPDVTFTSRLGRPIGRPLFLRGGSNEGDTVDSTKSSRRGKKASDKNGSNPTTSKRKKKKKRKSKQAKPGIDSNNDPGISSTYEDDAKFSKSTNEYENTETSLPSKNAADCTHDTKDAGNSSHVEKMSDSTKREQRNVPNSSSEHPKKSKQENLKSDDLIEEIISSTDLYKILSLNKSEKSSLTSIQITKAYRRRAVLTHPDKLNGDRRAFDKVSEAYDVLSDEQKKKIYDKFGLEAVKDPDLMAKAAASARMGGAFNGMGGAFQDQILRSFFGAGASASDSFSRMSSQLRKNKDVKYELEVSLEDMYSAAHREVQIPQPSGPKVVSVEIPSGIVSGSSIRLPGVVDHVTNATPGDVTFIVKQRRHEIFTRNGHDLAIELKMSLSEAICGFERKIIHLDGREVNITGPRMKSVYTSKDKVLAPSVIQTGDIHVLKGEGMPKRGRTSLLDDDENLQDRCERYGDLYVQYTVDMPNANEAILNKLSAKERETLGYLLNKLEGIQPKIPNDSSSSKLQSLQRAKASDFGRASGIAEVQHDGDEHMHTEEDHYARSNVFQNFSSSGRRSFASSFTSSNFGSNDEGDVQCQQM